ncbi:MAG: two component transcriptional regulator, Fis family [Pedosphaera sp.]|nr:two component transcriptional regulator, Fis family [Pedosphaera sp.]
MPNNKTDCVLLLDDQPDWIRINTRALEKAGICNEGFVNRERALRAVEQNPDRFNVLIMDVNLGGNPDGVEMARKMFAIKPSANIVLISTEAQIGRHTDQLEELAKTHVVQYARKTADEHGGKQVVDIAKSYCRPELATTGGPLAPMKDAAPPSGGLMIWMEAGSDDGTSTDIS